MTNAVLAIQMGKGAAAKRARELSRKTFKMLTNLPLPPLPKRHPFYKQMREGNIENAKKTLR